ncbi:MAG: hypothetical protein ACOYLL_06565 [Beijerinckiaceae bacterium]
MQTYAAGKNPNFLSNISGLTNSFDSTSTATGSLLDLKANPIKFTQTKKAAPTRAAFFTCLLVILLIKNWNISRLGLSQRQYILDKFFQMHSRTIGAISAVPFLVNNIHIGQGRQMTVCTGSRCEFTIKDILWCCRFTLRCTLDYIIKYRPLLLIDP